MAKRSIPEKDYEILAKHRQNSLNTNSLNPNQIITSNESFIIYSPDEVYRYKEFDGKLVDIHYIILPKDDTYKEFYELDLEDLSKFQNTVKELQEECDNCSVTFNSCNCREIRRKWYADFITFKQ